MSRRRRTAAILAALTTVALVMGICPWLARNEIGPPQAELPQTLEGGSELVSGQFIGHTEASIVERFGQPTHTWRGHYGNPPLSYRLKYLDAITTTYNRATGTLYLSFC
jgi:hypothetical protein